MVKRARLGFVSTEGEIFHINENPNNSVLKRKKKKDEEAPAMAAVTQTTKPTTDIRTIKTAENNLKKAESDFEEKDKQYQKALSNEIKKTGVDYKTKFDDKTKKRISYETKEEDNKKAQPKVIPVAELSKNIPKEAAERQEAYDRWKIANYENNLAKVNNEESTFLDKTIGTPIRAIKDLLSPLATGEDNEIVDEKGNKTFLPSYNELKQQKVRQDTKGALGVAQDVAYNATKVLGAAALDIPTMGLGGKALYWSDMATDNFKNIKNQGYDDKAAIANTIIATGTEFLTEKMLGGLSKELTGGQLSKANKVFNNAIGKAIKNPKIAQVLGSMGSEGLEEFTQEWVGALNDKVTLGKDTNIDDLVQDSLYSALVGAGTGGLVRGANVAFTTDPMTKIQNLNEVERDALTKITQKRINGEQLDENDIATINYLNNRDNIQEEQIPTQQATQQEIPIENIPTQEVENTPTQELEGTPIQTQPQTPQIQPAEEETTETRPVEQETQKEPQKEVKTPSEKRMYNGRDYSGDRFKGFTDDDIKSFDRLYDKFKNKEQFTPEEQIETDRLAAKQKDYLKRKSEGLKNPELTTNNTYEETKKELGKTKLNNYDDKLMSQAKEIVEANKQGRRTKQQWLDAAKFIGMQMKDADSKTLKEYALQTFKSERPNIKENLNRQGSKFVDFKVNEWVNAVYEGAGVGTKTETQEAKVEENAPKENAKSVAASKEKNIPAEMEKEPVLKIETKEQKKQHFKDNGASDEIAEVMSEMKTPDSDKTLKEKIDTGKANLREQWQWFKRNFVDKGEAVYTLAKKTKNRLLYAKFDKMGTSVAEGNYQIGNAQTNLNGKEYNNFKRKNKETGKVENVSMSLNDIWEGIDPKIANEYLAHYLNIDRYNQKNSEGDNKYVFGPSITDKDSQARVKQLEKEHPELRLFGENIWQYGQNQLQNMVDAGVISKSQAEQFKKETPHYVRLQRNIPEKSKNVIEVGKDGKAKVNKQIIEFKGSTLDILPFKETMAQYTLDSTQSMRANLFGQELAKTLSMGSRDDSIDSLSTFDESFGVNPELIKDNGDGTYSLTFFNNGVATVIPINEGIYESLQPSKHYAYEDLALFKGIRKMDTVRKGLLTDKNPLFLATNMLKDAFDAPLNSKHPVLFAKNYFPAIIEILKKGKMYQQYQALGGLQNTYFEHDEGFTKQGSKYNPINWITKMNNAVEQFPRLAEFMSTMEKTGNIDEAMYNAAEITTNFKRGGDIAKSANRNGVTFLNASIQGFSKQVRNFTDIQNPKQAVQMLGKVIALGIAPSLFNDLAYEDDDDYKDLQEYQKDNYYLIKKGDNSWVRIPKGRAISIFQSAARRTKYALGGDKKAFDGFVKQASSQIAPNNPFENNLLSPIVDVKRNESWSGNPIVSDYKSNKTHPEEEFDVKTDEFSKWLGKVNYIIDQYSGVLGDLFLPMGTKYAESKSDNIVFQSLANPWLNKFTTNSITSNKSQQEFYDALNKAEDDKNWSKGTEKDKAVYKYLNNRNGEIAEIRKEMTEMQESNMSNSKKFEKALEYQEKINNIAKDAVKQVKNVKKPNKNEFSIGNKSYVVSDGDVKSIKDETVQKAKDYGLSVGDYVDITSQYGTIKADKDENGETISGSKKQKFIDYVEAKKELSEQQKIAIIQKYYKKYTGE